MRTHMDKLVKSIKSDVKAMHDKMNTVEDKIMNTVEEKMNSLEKKNTEQFSQLLKILGANNPAEPQKILSKGKNK